MPVRASVVHHLLAICVAVLLLGVASTGRAACIDGDPCDDGNACTSGDICTGSVCGGLALPNGTSCSDGNACTALDTCIGGACSSGPAVACSPCQACDPGSGCMAMPRGDCRLAEKPEKGSLQFTDGTPDRKDIVKWKWPAGSATTIGDLADPTTTSDVTLCVFDASGGTPALAFRATAPAGGLCGSRPCWRSKASGFDYNNGAATGDGLISVKLKSGNAGKAKMLLKGKGAALSSRPFGLPAPPLPLPLRAQLQVEGGACFEAWFDAAGVLKNEEGSFRARAMP